MLCSLTVLVSGAQKNFGIDQDYYIYKRSTNSVVPLIYYQSNSNWYASLRYNYEEDNTVSFQFGKTFSKEASVSYSVTPLAGLLGGDFNGISIGALAEMETGRFSLYTEPQYCRKFTNTGENFFYNWAELSFRPCNFFYAGIATQTVKERQSFITEPGLMLGITIRNFEIPLYLFRSAEHANYFVVGIHWALGD